MSRVFWISLIVMMVVLSLWRLIPMIFPFCRTCQRRHFPRD